MELKNNIRDKPVYGFAESYVDELEEIQRKIHQMYKNVNHADLTLKELQCFAEFQQPLKYENSDHYVQEGDLWP